MPGDDPHADRRSFIIMENGELEVTDAGGNVAWRGTVDDCAVIDLARCPDRRSAVLLLNPDGRPTSVEPWHPFANVVRVDDLGRTMWRGELPRGERSFTSGLRIVGETVAIHAWSGDAILDIATGRLLDFVFTK